MLDNMFQAVGGSWFKCWVWAIEWMIVPFPCWTITAAAGKQEIGWVVDPLRPVFLRFVMINVQRLMLEQAVRAKILKEVLKEPAPILLIGCPRRKRWRWT